MHIAIIGNGIGGVTAARFIRKLGDHKITLISAETEHFFSRTALMYVYMGHMRYEDLKPYEDWFWTKNRIDLKRAYVSKIDTANKKLLLEGQGDLAYDKLIIACGSTPNKFGWPGQDLKRVQGMYSFQDLEGMEAASPNLKQAVIVGGGLIGIEMAEMFHSRHIPVTFLVREKSYWSGVLPAEESAMINRHILENGIDLRLETELKEIVDNGKGEAGAAIPNKGAKIDCQFVGLTAGVRPNIDFVKNGSPEIETQKGIVVDEFLETSVKDVYAIGDCAQIQNPLPGRRPVEAIWYTGKMMGEVVAYNVCGKKKAYDPGIWFNSAKFFDIEYQVYGTVLAKPPENHASIYWEHKDGRKSIRIIYDSLTKETLGFNLMGVRYRHEVCEKWIRDKTPVETVLQNLGIANFDPEFYKEYESDVVRLYNAQTGSNLKLQKKRSLTNALKFLREKVGV